MIWLKWQLKLVLKALLIVVGVFMLPAILLVPGEIWGRTSYTYTVPIFVIVTFVLLIYFFIWIFRYSSKNPTMEPEEPPEYREAREAGLLLPARLLEIRQLNHKIGLNHPTSVVLEQHGRGFWGLVEAAAGKSRWRAWRHLLRLQVQPPDAPPYEVTLKIFIDSNVKKPSKGAPMQVRVHPRHPEVIVLENEAALRNEPQD